jgi:hypothetical protein
VDSLASFLHGFPALCLFLTAVVVAIVHAMRG